ncbi:hypothetical protein BKA69DRAFT_1157150 [Paraphysoderma sedebokerense]|nr:hypothetical protein BKA69DRAFT_1157150 [Paraphysoderma sedebokerense]
MVVPLDLPVISLAPFLADPSSQDAIAEAKKAADAMKTYGALLVKDPRVTEQHNTRFLDTMENYFGQDHDVKMKDARPEWGYQVGVTPEFTEEPLCLSDLKCMEVMNSLPEGDKPTMWSGPDPKWRFFWRIGKTRSNTKYPALNAAPVVPEAFASTWESTMNNWGTLMHDAVIGVAQLVASGLGLKDKGAFLKKAMGGPHLLAPTGSDLRKYNKLGTVFAGFHYDFNLLTIHGKSRFPGLHIWARNSGSKMAVRVPEGCLLVQAGKQLEILTGGEILAGYHEVVVTPATLAAVEKAQSENRSLWRISSTFFLHVASDEMLEPLAPYDTEDRMKVYPSIECGEFVKKELEGIKLMK